MTKKQLEELGFKEYSYNTYLHPIYFKYTVEIKESSTINDILSFIYNKGVEDGVCKGYAELQESLRHLLNVPKIAD